MYGIYEITGAHGGKRRAFDYAAFATIAEALAHLEPLTSYAEIDQEHDAADVFTTSGLIYSVERVGPMEAAELANRVGMARTLLEMHTRSREAKRDAQPAGDLPLFNETARAQRDLF